VVKRTHSAVPPPFCMAGTGVVCERTERFTEAQAEESGLRIDPGHELMEYFLKSGKLGKVHPGGPGSPNLGWLFIRVEP